MTTQSIPQLSWGASGPALLKNIWQRRQASLWLEGLGLFSLFILIFALIQFATPSLIGNDGYYHIKLAQIMRQQGLHPDFPWLPFTVLNSSAYVDHHFLYHVLLIPFTFGDLRMGAKWASIIFPALTFLSIWMLLRGQRVRYAALWTLGLFAVSDAFLYRMSMPRTQAVSLLVMVVGLHLILTGRHRWLLPLSFLFVWLYDAFPLMLIVAGAYTAAKLLLEQKLDHRPLLYTACGIGLGLLINPYFPNNLLFIYHHLFPKLTDATATSVGREWYPYETWTLVENSGGALALVALGIVALGLRDRRMSISTATMLFLTLLFATLLFRSRRFIEYFPAFALLFGVLSLQPFIEQGRRANGWLRRGLPLALALIVLVTAVGSVQAGQTSVQESKPHDRFAEAAAWLEQNTPAGSLVFQTDWDDFTRLFYYNTHKTYTLGLDPTYMQLHDPALYDLWVDLTRGRVETPAETITANFGARFILSDLQHKGFMREANDDPNIKEVYRDEYAVIYEIAN
ncbi:MAG: hypothetical protein R3264_03910 [Anaerolineae bacterium]|nr:hypothetical protein [Anaerolineae bacterium]